MSDLIERLEHREKVAIDQGDAYTAELLHHTIAALSNQASIVDKLKAELQAKPADSELVEEMERSGAACLKSLSYRIVPCDVFDKAITALQSKQVPDVDRCDALRNKLEGMRFDLSLMAASDVGFDVLEAKCEAVDECIQIVESIAPIVPEE